MILPTWNIQVSIVPHAWHVKRPYTLMQVIQSTAVHGIIVHVGI
ncbi:MAG TPA: hypothetical protein VJ571_06170 [Candidatus Nitrosotalea sp.]|nr:hypothetical protein [Candidatus Nitrosotalea sp.]